MPSPSDHPALDALKLLPPYHEPMDTELSCDLANDRIAELEAELAAERGKRCGTCRMNSKCLIQDACENSGITDFGCTEWAEQGATDE